MEAEIDHVTFYDVGLDESHYRLYRFFYEFETRELAQYFHDILHTMEVDMRPEGYYLQGLKGSRTLLKHEVFSTYPSIVTCPVGEKIQNKKEAFLAALKIKKDYRKRFKSS